MYPRTALVLGAVLAALFGTLLIVAPTPLLAGFGLDATPAALVVSRDVGATLLGVAVIDWLARGATGAGLMAVLAGNIAIQALEIVVNGYAIATGALPAAAAGGLVLHAAIGAVFLLAVLRPTRAL